MICDDCKMAEHFIKKSRRDELDKISKMILLGCEELECENCPFKMFPQNVCQDAYTFDVINNYILKELEEKDESK